MLMAQKEKSLLTKQMLSAIFLLRVGSRSVVRSLVLTDWEGAGLEFFQNSSREIFLLAKSRLSCPWHQKGMGLGGQQ
jgi:hypothetical protein